LREDFVDELLIWRPIIDGIVSLADVKNGEIDIDDLLKINAILDMRAAAEHREIERARSKK